MPQIGDFKIIWKGAFANKIAVKPVLYSTKVADELLKTIKPKINEYDTQCKYFSSFYDQIITSELLKGLW